MKKIIVSTLMATLLFACNQKHQPLRPSETMRTESGLQITNSIQYHMDSIGNARHNELRTGEMWIANIHTSDHDSAGLTFQKIPFKTKRKGDIAYNESAEPITNMRPVFIQKTEWESMIKTRDSLANLK